MIIIFLFIVINVTKEKVSLSPKAFCLASTKEFEHQKSINYSQVEDESKQLPHLFPVMLIFNLAHRYSLDSTAPKGIILFYS